MSDSETIQLLQELRKYKQEKRANNRSFSQQLLAEEGINFSSGNDGVHLIIVDHDITYDFWPGTGKWTRRGSGKYYRGVRHMINHIKAARPKKETP